MFVWCVSLWNGINIKLVEYIVVVCENNNNTNTIKDIRYNGGIGRHEGLKIPWPLSVVRVQVPIVVQSVGSTYATNGLY